MKKLLALFLALMATVGGARAASEGIAWDTFPEKKLTDLAALQHGAKLFTNYCLNCHAAAFMRYTRLRDLGLSDAQIKSNLMFSTDKMGETMKVALNAKDAKDWFGGLPPDLTVIARSRAGKNGTGADYLYTYLRTYFRDDSKATGWNNLAYPGVGMPHVLWELQGQRAAVYKEVADDHDPAVKHTVFAGYEQLSPGKLSPQAYDDAVADLVAYMTWMGEPVAKQRVRLGVWVLLFLAVFMVIAWRLNAAYWKDVK